MLITDFVTVSDEAFIYLVLENYWNKWTQQDAENATTKWTSRRNSGDKCRGWPDEAKLRYNELVVQVLDDRERDTSKQVEEDFKEHLKAREELNQKRKKERMAQPEHIPYRLGFQQQEAL